MAFLLLIVGLSLFLATSGFFSASETALFSLSPMKVRSFRTSSSKRSRLIANLLDRPNDLLITILMINVAINICIQNFVSSLFGSESNWWMNVGLPLVLTLLFGEAIPKSIAISRNAKMAKIASPILVSARFFFGPIRVIMNKIASLLSQVIFFFLKREEVISIDELVHALETSKKLGVVSTDEAKLIHGSLRIDELVVKEVMRPRQEILAYDIRDPLDALLKLFIDEECSQIPVIQGSVDTIYGIATSDLFFLHRKEIHEPLDLKRFIREPFFVPETLTAHRLLSQFQERKETMAIVVDEYGQTSGLLTKEDIVEVVIGQISDKIDTQAPFTRQSEDVIISSGKLELHELEEIFDVRIDTADNMVTVGGYLTEKLGDIPKSGAKFVTDQLLFHVLSATPSRVTRVYIRKLKPKERGGKSHA